MAKDQAAETDLSVLARRLGLPDDADEDAVVAAINAQTIGLIEHALGLRAGAGRDGIIAEIAALQADRAAYILHMLGDLGGKRKAIRTLQVREIMSDALREARDTLDP
ncbi:phage protease [Methylobacterium platani]|uniref:Uncharacterized protein n=2 Tax=Methylobacterium platani TaxID=427683 RepID=A0A179SHY6_9HYPH|nr:phage protease [Methylobacterium platani]KMO16520.1 hypothetical protein SQ03_14555 [Methylobacterium platani JCM 14648]OAS27458.1 hypothetical protein A5481_01465 [Methylobacterium platani]